MTFGLAMSGTVNHRKRRQNATPTSKLDDLDLPWYQLYQPLAISDVAVHGGKQKEVRNWLNTVHPNVHANDNDLANGARSLTDEKVSRIALLTGPAGSGKTTLVRLLCQEGRIEVKEFSCDEIKASDAKPAYGQNSMDYGGTYNDQSQVNQFKDFIFDQNRRKIGSFDSASSGVRRIILVEDFPNGFFLTPERYHDVLRKMSNVFKSYVPIVFIVSDNGESAESLIEDKSRSKFTSYSLFPPSLMAELNITQIKFNPVATTFLNKALKRLPKYQIFSKDDIDHVSSLGDIRSAFNSLELNYKYLPSITNSLLSNNKRLKMQFPGEEATSSLNNDSQTSTTLAKPLDLVHLRDRVDTTFHYIGKIIYSKRLVPPDQIWPSKVRELPLADDINELTRKSPITPERLLLNLHQMYSKPTLGRLDQSARIIEHLSLADRLGHYDYSLAGDHNLSQEIQSEIAIRGSMYYLPPRLVTSDRETYRGITPWPERVVNNSKGLILQSRIHFYDHQRNRKNIESEAREIRENLFPFHCTLDSLFLDLLFVMNLDALSYSENNEEDFNTRKRKFALGQLIQMADQIRRLFDIDEFDHDDFEQVMQGDFDNDIDME